MFVSDHPQSLTVQPNFSQKYGTLLLFSLGIIGVLVSGYIRTQKKDRKP
jgi:hypothetical protein